MSLEWEGGEHRGAFRKKACGEKERMGRPGLHLAACSDIKRDPNGDKQPRGNNSGGQLWGNGTGGGERQRQGTQTRLEIQLEMSVSGGEAHLTRSSSLMEYITPPERRGGPD
ncbi:hypothetical protein AAFF_G00151050 [Aldrovandia affinis]|uniref:Uncharacterized protein n=1 Tax=Aldrovandia affinis TaxID=143900 RepID=A0AAD7W9C5_9TELE|nr:hypothetical protein AAFF_G00151050 [Aldrovandia affinis]